MKWEYKIVQVNATEESSNNPEALQNEFNKYGSENWEIVQVIDQDKTGFGWLPNTERKNIILKRSVS